MPADFSSGNDRCCIFAYGTLKPGERAFVELCQPFAIATQPAQTHGRLYHLPLGYPAMTLEVGWVRGVLLTFPDSDCLKAIDAFEEYYPDRPDSSEYQRHRQLIYDHHWRSLGLAWVYTMNRDRVIALGGQWLSEGCWTEA
ncbi:gamma-glutamylcyclotransferase [Nodosilinea sp. LEGE 07088]|uniref:gamma-glutamylcyclotransferase family protein n=1 Tax=Nodosilinea sp. LEGE 07088 TaxID=2777968 RepID=UPI001882DEDB|nr:gamma-glutamylcyclotransferase family protein [Nodosilinea sp. LEGE 07088]MBE9136547.1 gamma-glutamylcyclotransferase [Nodosilinea sp. LEGE 07088]